MESQDLNRIVWPSCVDIFGQVVVTMAFFFLLIFIILAYFLAQIEFSKRVQSTVISYQTLYKPIADFSSPSNIKKQNIKKENLDNLILQIETYVKSVPVDRVVELKTLIKQRDNLVKTVHKLGFTSYTPQPLKAEIDTMAVISGEIINFKGRWDISRQGDSVIINFSNNGIIPDEESLASIRTTLRAFVATLGNRRVQVEGTQSPSVRNNALSSRQVIARNFEIRNILNQFGVDKRNIELIKSPPLNSYPHGAIFIKVMPN